MSSWKGRWPLGRGFERYYGFLGGETNQWYPDLVYDNHPVEPPTSPEEGYHLSKDLADKAIEFVRDAKAVAPDKPWFMYFCPGCAPRAAPRLDGVVGPLQGPVRRGLRGDPRRRSWPASSSWGCSARTSSCRPSTRTASRTRRGPTASPGRRSTSCARGTR